MSPATYCAPGPKPVRAVLDITERGLSLPKIPKPAKLPKLEDDPWPRPTPLPEAIPEARSVYVLEGDASAFGATPPAPETAPTQQTDPCLDELDPACSAHGSRPQ